MSHVTLLSIFKRNKTGYGTHTYQQFYQAIELIRDSYKYNILNDNNSKQDFISKDVNYTSQCI